MKVNLKKVLVVCAIFMLFVSIINSSFAVTADFDKIGTLSNSSAAKSSNDVTNAAKNVWSTVVTLVQILAVAAVVFAGVRYMFASADAKADIKKQTVILIIGAVLVFGATAILTLVSNATGSIIGN